MPGTERRSGLEALRAEEATEQVELNEATKSQDKLLNKRTMLSDIVLQKQKLIRELGTLPRKELEEFKNLQVFPAIFVVLYVFAVILSFHKLVFFAFLLVEMFKICTLE